MCYKTLKKPYMKQIVVLALLIPLFLYSCKQDNNDKNSSQPPMAFRSVSFQITPDSNMIARAAQLGFNNMCIHTEGSTLAGLKRIRDIEEEKGYFEYAKSLGMTVAVWMREISDYKGDPADITIKNESFWNDIKKKYKFYFTEMVPEVDYIFFTVVESQINLADSDILVKMVKTVNDLCKEHGKKLILRTFIHDVSELQPIKESMEKMPDDIIIMTKNVEQDWRMRGPGHQLLGETGNKEQYVEICATNEYFRWTYVANCYTDNYFERYQRWIDKGISGIDIRVSRHPREGAWWDPMKFRHVVYAEPNEVLLWTLGYVASGKSGDIDEPWDDFCNFYFGEETAGTMENILRPQGEMIAEAQNVGVEPFGMRRIHIPGEWTMNGEHCKCGDTIAIAYDDDEDMLYRNPFHQKQNVHRWHPEYKKQYHKIRKGHPSVIKTKSAACEKQIAISDSLLNIYYTLEGNMDDKTYEYYRFKLEENNWYLKVMTHWILAWLKALYFEDADKDKLHDEIAAHFNALMELNKETDESLKMNWYGKNIDINRGEYLDIPGYIKMFSKYWQLNN